MDPTGESGPGQAPPAGGDPAAELTASLYAELRRVAAQRMRGERPGHVLDPTGLVHEAWLRLRQVPGSAPSGRTHLLAFGAALVRRVLVDHARANRAAKRGGGAAEVPLDLTLAAPEGPPLDLFELDQALERLALASPRQARVVELRFFGGLTVPETAEVLGLSVDTIKREWRFARAWLNRALGGSEGER
jgi:RNA polymerase sigma factor (TIGR02999 family)